MIQFNPQVQDRRGDYMMMAAQANANAMSQMGSDIGGALSAIGGMYGEIEGNKAKGRAFKDVFKVVAPTVGMSMEQLEGVAGGKIKSDMDWYNVSQTMGPMMPALINMQLGQQRMGVQRDQQNLAAAGPAIRAANTNAAAVSSQGGPSLPGATRRFGN
jgi:hypothetical protein